MVRRIVSMAVVMASLAGCGGNPFQEEPAVVEPTDPDPIELPEPLPDDFMPVGAASGDVESAELAAWSSNAGVIRVKMDAQISPTLTTDFVRDANFDVEDASGNVAYYGYSHQTTAANRKAVVLVREAGNAKAMIAMEPGQFANGSPDMMHSGGALYRADVFKAPKDGGQGNAFNYSGTYAGLLNSGRATVNGPDGNLSPTESYRTSGEALVTADFTRMKVSGGVTNRKVVDTGTTLANVALWTTNIGADGTFNGIVYRGDDVPPTTAGAGENWSSAGRYEGMFAGLDAKDVAIIMLFQPMSGGGTEQGMIVAPNCASAGAGASCRP